MEIDLPLAPGRPRFVETHNERASEAKEEERKEDCLDEHRESGESEEWDGEAVERGKREERKTRKRLLHASLSRNTRSGQHLYMCLL